MNKEEFIKYCINNNYCYTETPSEIRIDKIIDNLENVNFSFIYYKENKNIQFCCNEYGNKEFNDIEYKIFINLKNIGDSDE